VHGEADAAPRRGAAELVRTASGTPKPARGDPI
jgi:hypothetical protein